MMTNVNKHGFFLNFFLKSILKLKKNQILLAYYHNYVK